MKRYAKVIELKADKLEEYRRLHRAVWPEVYAMISACNIRNFTIFLHRFPHGQHYLFMYFEYIGQNYTADMERMAADPKTQEWWRLTDPCQEPLSNRVEGEWWSEMEEVCHHP